MWGPSCLLVLTGLLFSWGSAMDGREMILSNANEREVIPTCVCVRTIKQTNTHERSTSYSFTTVETPANVYKCTLSCGGALGISE